VTQSALFTPLSIRSTTFRNRLWVPALCQYSVELHDGVPTDWHLVHLGSFALGGAGLVMTEATAVEPIGRISPHDTGIWNDEQVAAWSRITAFLHERGAVAGIQLAHAGRKASTHRGWDPEARGTVSVQDGGWATVGPSAVAFDGYAVPRELSGDEIADIVTHFAEGARRSVAAGFDLVEIHAAHGYLLHQFLSPLSNLRTDEYGGGLENRARLLLDVVRAVRAVVGEERPVFVRLSATDYAEGGWNQEDTATVSGWAHEAGADFFDISSGGNVAGATIPLSPGYQVPFADYVKSRAQVAVNAVGLITTAGQAEEIVATGKSDAVMMGRELMRDPHFALRAAHELGVEVDYWPEAYRRARWH
jgi:2,4-dienoyl-CoA reductase-like NADH-dependent reductase (Old Yellow Enzyme family)